MLDERAYTFLRSINLRHQRKIERAFDSLKANPFAEPSFIDCDADGEPLFHFFAGPYTVVYHVDHAAKLVLVLDIFPNS